MIFTCITLVLLNFGMGVIYANYKEKNPIRISSSQGAAISFLLNIIFMVFLVVVLLKPFNNFFGAINNYSTPDYSIINYSILIIGIASLLISFLIYRLSTKTLLKDF
jgi:formate-dependent nitrite reductase membrane component NrfD